MVISSDVFEAALGDFLVKTDKVSIKNVLGEFDKDKTVSQNIAKLKETYSGNDLQETIAYLKLNYSSEYPVAENTLSNKNRNKEKYSEDIAKFLDFVKPSQCLSCKVNYIPAAENSAGHEPKCYLCQRPSHAVCHKETVIKPDIGLIFLCTECISVKAAKQLSEELQKAEPKLPADNEKPDPGQQPPQPTDSREKPRSEPATENDGNKEEETQHNQQDCPLYQKRSCPHGLTGKRHINGKPCPYKHRRLCYYYSQHGPSGCRFKNKCRFFHPEICQNSTKLHMCLNRSCKEFHIPGTRRYAQEHQLTNNEAPKTAQSESSHRPPGRQSNPQSPWSWSTRHQQAELKPEHQQPSRDSEANEAVSFLDKYFASMKESLSKSILENIQNIRPQPQLLLMQPPNQNPHAPPHQLFTQPETTQNQNQIHVQNPRQQEPAIPNQTHPHMFNQQQQFQQQFPPLMAPVIPVS